MIATIENECVVHFSVAGVSYSIDAQSLGEICSQYGQVVDGKWSDLLLSFSCTIISSPSFFGKVVSNSTLLIVVYSHLFVARIIMDRETGRHRGFGFITYSNVDEASRALQALDGQVKQIFTLSIRISLLAITVLCRIIIYTYVC